MLKETSIRTQVEASRGDRLRVLIVGAGIAGLTLAQLLRRRGLAPVLVERAGPDAPNGYMLALMPLVDPVFEALGATEAYRSGSVAMNRFRIRDRRGSVIREYTMGGLLKAYGDYRGVSRGDLMEVLASSGGAVTHGITVTGLEQPGSVVAAAFDDGSEAEFDAVIVADGLHSATRDLVLTPEQVKVYDTGWGGWVVWTDADEDDDLGEELWGVGAFVGTYPVNGRLGAIVCGSRDDAHAGLDSFVARLRTAVPTAGDRMARVLTEAVDGRDAYYWSLTDCRSATWSSGRIGLVGDAAAGFLPTAGIGAGMAMESAWVLADRLARSDPADVPAALVGYEKAQRPRVEAAQDNSRNLAPLLFNDASFAATLRDCAARYIPLGIMLGPIRKLLEDRPAGVH
ncbi:FAD-dependent monooxygenase [Glycomyces sp. L485]|uniref:FAD-dependent oxidoreductase n=1 Tax=Glycomyces sp. L485 TaxID=2909235 RepID=UPI001F4B4E3F|nr:FAD-dependent monooxygenase [Glycomyces sp. L485]